MAKIEAYPTKNSQGLAAGHHTTFGHTPRCYSVEVRIQSGASC